MIMIDESMLPTEGAADADGQLHGTTDCNW